MLFRSVESRQGTYPPAGTLEIPNPLWSTLLFLVVLPCSLRTLATLLCTSHTLYTLPPCIRVPPYPCPLFCCEQLDFITETFCRLLLPSFPTRPISSLSSPYLPHLPHLSPPATSLTTLLALLHIQYILPARPRPLIVQYTSTRTFPAPRSHVLKPLPAPRRQPPKKLQLMLS